MRARCFPTLPPPLRGSPRPAGVAAQAALLCALPGCILVEKGAFDSAEPPSSVESSPTTTPAPGDDPAPADRDSGEVEVAPAPLTLRFIDGVLELWSTPAQPGARVGLAETRGPCLEAGACWTGEDCRSPFVGADGVERPPLCRSLAAYGALTLEAGVPLSAVDEDSTLFRPSSADDISWSLTGADGACVAGGANPAYFSGCTPFLP